MTLPVKIVIALTLVALLYHICTSEIGTCGYLVKVKYQDNLIEYKTASETEYKELLLKERNKCLFFDGQYFFEEAPRDEIKEFSRVNIVYHGTIILNGDMSIEKFIGICLLILIAGLILIGIVTPSDDSYDY